MASSLQTSAETYFVGKETMCFKCTVSVPDDGQKIDVPFSMVFRELGGRRQDWFLRVLRLTLCNTDLSLSLFSYDRLDDLDTDIILCNCKFLLIKPDTQEVVHTLTTGVCGSVVYRRRNEGVVEKRLASYSQYCYDDTLTVQIEADFFFLTTDTPLHDNIRSNLHTLYKTGTLTDAIIRCDCTEFKVHKIVLVSQSPVFQEMFEIDTGENGQCVVEVLRISSAVMSELVTYLYTGTAPNIKTLGEELLDAATKYQLHRLFKMCTDELYYNTMTPNSVAATLIQSEIEGKEDLKKVCLEFMCSNRLKVFKTDEHNQVLKEKYRKLYVEALEYCSDPAEKN